MVVRIRAASAEQPPLQPTSYLQVYRATPQQRIRVIKQGMRATDAKRILSGLAIPQGRVFKALHISQATVNRKAQRNDVLNAVESERILGMAKLVGQVQAIVEESGDPEGFDAGAWLSSWLQEPSPALGGSPPVEFMDTIEGQAIVSRLLAQVQSGAYA